MLLYKDYWATFHRWSLARYAGVPGAMAAIRGAAPRKTDDFRLLLAMIFCTSLPRILARRSLSVTKSSGIEAFLSKSNHSGLSIWVGWGWGRGEVGAVSKER